MNRSADAITRTGYKAIARTLISVCVGAAALIATPAAAAAPEPAPVATQWEFTFEPGPLRLAWVDENGTTKPYFYLTYRITNHWGGAKLFAPDVSLMTDNTNVLRSGRGVSASVTAEIMRRLKNPLLESQIDIVSNVLEGVEHARDGVVIWPAEDLQADEIAIFFAGLSGEFQSYVTGRNTSDPQRYTLRKTMMLRYSTPGEMAQQGDRPFELIEERWVMR
ncbi:MAG: hypothetical protein KDA29_00295 [Phycisphaerales bacterium]|nr:hypothetical protein [Phycisphaerales bacterium]